MSTATPTAASTAASVAPSNSVKLEHEMRAFEHFSRLAKRGRHRAASGGEQRAWRIAKRLLEDSAGLDDLALEGLAIFAKMASYSHDTAERAVR